MQRPYVLGLSYSILLALIYAVGQQNLEFMLHFTNIIFPATSGAVVLVSFWVMKRYVGNNLKPMFSLSWVFLSTGLTLWFLGDLTWGTYGLLTHSAPVPSLADCFFIGGYLLIIPASFLILTLFQTVFSRKKFLLNLGTTVGLSAVVSGALVVPIMNSGKNLLTTTFSAAYPILDIGLFAVAFSILLVFFEGTLGKAWMFITLTIILNIVADLLFTYADLQGFYYEGHPLELFWLWGYVAAIIGLYIHRREL
jgi:hypothetical protein